jgi:hypothetical protein
VRTIPSRAAGLGLWKAVVTLILAAGLLSCEGEPSAVQVYQALLNQALPESAKVTDWKVLRGIGELHAFFSIEMPKEAFEQAFSHDVFVRNTEEEEPEMLAMYARDISQRMGHQVSLPSPAVHLVSRVPGRQIHVFWQDTSHSLLVWITPGPAH